MSRFLLDTSILLWAIDASPRLSKTHRDIMNNEPFIFISAVSIWEISIKVSTGKLQAPNYLSRHVLEMGYSLLDISAQHAEAVRTLPPLHRDPFDRMLVAQAQTENLSLLTADDKIKQYDIATI